MSSASRNGSGSNSSTVYTPGRIHFPVSIINAQTIPGVKRIRFFMTFGQSYLDHMRCLEDVGMLSTTPINFNGQEIVPIQFLKALLPMLVLPLVRGPRLAGSGNRALRNWMGTIS